MERYSFKSAKSLHYCEEESVNDKNLADKIPESMNEILSNEIVEKSGKIFEL